MFLPVALAFLAASAPSAQAPAQAAAAAAAPKPRRICRTEEIIGSVTPKRVCFTLPPADESAAQKPARGSGDAQQQSAAPAAGNGN